MKGRTPWINESCLEVIEELFSIMLTKPSLPGLMIVAVGGRSEALVTYIAGRALWCSLLNNAHLYRRIFKKIVKNKILQHKMKPSRLKTLISILKYGSRPKKIGPFWIKLTCWPVDYHMQSIGNLMEEINELKDNKIHQTCFGKFSLTRSQGIQESILMLELPKQL